MDLASPNEWKRLSEVTAARQAMMLLFFCRVTSRRQPTDSTAWQTACRSAPRSRREAMIMSPEAPALGSKRRTFIGKRWPCGDKYELVQGGRGYISPVDMQLNLAR